MIKYEDALLLAADVWSHPALAVLGPCQYHVGGSTYITGQGNDVDVIVYQGTDPNDVIDLLRDSDWALCGEESYESCGMFAAFRRGDINLIITDDLVYYGNWLIARDVCKYIRINYADSGRDMRVAMHKMIVDGELE